MSFALLSIVDGARTSGVEPSFESSKQAESLSSKREGPSEPPRKRIAASFDGEPTSDGIRNLQQSTDQCYEEFNSRPYNGDRWASPVDDSAYQPTDRQLRRDNREFRGRRSTIDQTPYDNRNPRTLEPMVIDDTRPRASAISSSISAPYDDRGIASRDGREKFDRLPKGPRANQPGGGPPLSGVKDR